MRIVDSRCSPFFTPISLSGIYNRNISSLQLGDCSERVFRNKEYLLAGENVLWGIPFHLGEPDETEKDPVVNTIGLLEYTLENNYHNNVLLLKDEPVTLNFPVPVQDRFLVFLHSVDFTSEETKNDGIYRPMRGIPRLGETVAEYALKFSDGTGYQEPIKRRFNINEFQLSFGEDSFVCVHHLKPVRFRSNSEEVLDAYSSRRLWGLSQKRTFSPGTDSRMHHWLYAMENPYPEKELISITFFPRGGVVFIFGLTTSNLESNPLRWEARKKIKLTLPPGQKVNQFGDYKDIDIDLGQVISVTPVLDYNNHSWQDSYHQKAPCLINNEIILEYTAHPAGCLYLGETSIPLKEVFEKESNKGHISFCRVPEVRKEVLIKVIDKKTRHPVAVKIHVHGRYGEYLSPVNRHRIPNPFFFEDYSVDVIHHSRHFCTYIPGVARFKLPLGSVYIEISKGFEVKPVREVFTVEKDTEEIIIELDHILPWRQKGWVTADTHVHFLSPQSALLEGEAEGVNIVNLLASQWGELMTNVGDFDGKSTLGSKENGGKGEYLVRVGTENRQRILGHISLLGYEGQMILPLATSGPGESALGDPVEATLCAWADQCRAQEGLAVLPHFPEPRAEGAAALVLEKIDGVEMTSWGELYAGISPYSLSDWYRYLNCGYQVPAVGGTDKMSASTAVGTIRTYALIENLPFTYENWKQVIRRGLTFVTYGPLLEFEIDGMKAGSKIYLSAGGGTIAIEWQVSSVTIPVTKVELVINGQTREVETIKPFVEEGEGNYAGRWEVKVKESSWFALRVRGCYPGKPEVITAHSSSIMVIVDEVECFNHQDALTILEQIEGATAYIKTLGTKAEEKIYKRHLLLMTSAHRALHNRLHQQGIFHKHSAADDHHQ